MYHYKKVFQFPQQINGQFDNEYARELQYTAVGLAEYICCGLAEFVLRSEGISLQRSSVNECS